MIRAVVDPGVFVSSVITARGTCPAVIDAWREGRYEIVVSEALLAEIIIVLTRPKFGVSPEYLRDLVEELRVHGRVREDPQIVPISRDPNDDYLLALAGASADVLVSGDRDLVEAPTFVPVLTPRAFLDALDGPDAVG